MELFNEGGLRDEGGTVEPESGNEVPSGSLQKEVADDIPVMISEGEFVFPADVVRYIGLNTLMKMRQDAKQGLKMMEKMGQMGNSEEAEIPDDIPFEMADLIVVSGEMKKDDDKKEKAEGGVVGMQSGGLFDDPRFASQTGAKSPPTLTDEDKKEIEDKLLGTVYGTITMKRYVDADGNVKYIPFIDDEPQMPIPDGYELDDSAPAPKSTIATTTSDSGDRTDDSGGARFTPNIQSPFADQGTTSFNINKLNAKELVDYYGSFSSPVNRFLSVGVGALFGGVPALGMAAMQQLAQTRGPNSLKATEELIAQKIRNGEISGDLLEQLKKFQKRALEKGTSPTSFLTNLINKISGKDEQKKSNLQNAIETGNVSGVDSEVADVDRSAFKVIDVSPVASDIDSKEEGANEIPAPIYQSIQAYLDDEKRSTEFRPQTLGVPASPEAKEQSQMQSEARAMVDRLNRQTITPAFALDMQELSGGAKALQASIAEDAETGGDDPFAPMGRRKTKEEIDRIRKGLEIGTPSYSLKGSPYETEDRRQIRTPKEDPRTKKRTRKADQPSTGILPRRGERFPDVGLDRPSKLGQTRVDDFLLGVQRDDKGNISNLTEQQQKNIRSNVQRQEDIRKKVAAEDRERQSRGFAPMDVSERFEREREEFTGFDSSGNVTQSGLADAYDAAGRGGPNPFRSKGGVSMYVGGVPTKPMKPQRLKKGGLAKPKVKPKRMKKGGLASRKK